jgi:hypothetical protein
MMAFWISYDKSKTISYVGSLWYAANKYMA